MRPSARRLSPDMVEILARSPHIGIRANLLTLIEVPDAVVIRLARDPSVEVRRMVAARFEQGWQPAEHYAPAAAYEALVDDDDEFIRDELLANPEVSPELVRRLERHDEIRDLVLLRVGDPGEAEAAYRRLVTHPNQYRRLAALTDLRFRPPADQVDAVLADESTRVEAALRVPLTPAIAAGLAA